MLDLFAVQMEYFNSPNLNNTYMVAHFNYAVPIQPDPASTRALASSVSGWLFISSIGVTR